MKRTAGMFLVCFLILAIVNGCASGPTTKEISAFGQATEKAVTIITVPDQLQSQLVLETTINRNTCLYLKGRHPQLAEKSEQKLLDVIAAQKLFSKALANYAKAIASATNQEGLKKLRAAASQFTSAVSTVASSAGAPSAPTSAVIGASVNLAINIGEIGRIQRIRSIMVDVYPYLIVAERLVEDDVDIIDAHLTKALDSWTKQADCVLNVSRHEPATATSLFAELDKKKRVILARKSSLGLAVDAIRKVKEAHLIVIESQGDLNQALDELELIIADAQTIKDAFEQ